jgi:hypothetical protein
MVIEKRKIDETNRRFMDPPGWRCCLCAGELSSIIPKRIYLNTRRNKQHNIIRAAGASTITIQIV